MSRGEKQSILFFSNNFLSTDENFFSPTKIRGFHKAGYEEKRGLVIINSK